MTGSIIKVVETFYDKAILKYLNIALYKKVSTKMPLATTTDALLWS